MRADERLAPGHEGFEALLRQVQADPDVLGVVLTGSHAQGLATPWSDYDIRVILRDEAGVGTQTRYPAAAFPNVDLRVMPLRICRLRQVGHALYLGPLQLRSRPSPGRPYGRHQRPGRGEGTHPRGALILVRAGRP